MAEFFKDNSKNLATAKALQKSTVDAPYEIQLVWLFELLMIRAFIKFVKADSAFIRASIQPDKLTLLERDCCRSVPLKYERTVQVLHCYRNAFVHGGYQSAANFLEQLLTMKEDILYLARLVKIKVEPEDMIFRKVDYK